MTLEEVTIALLKICLSISGISALFGISLYKIMGTADEAYDRED